MSFFIYSLNSMCDTPFDGVFLEANCPIQVEVNNFNILWKIHTHI